MEGASHVWSQTSTRTAAHAQSALLPRAPVGVQQVSHGTERGMPAPLPWTSCRNRPSEHGHLFERTRLNERWGNTRHCPSHGLRGAGCPHPCMSPCMPLFESRTKFTTKDPLRASPGLSDHLQGRKGTPAAAPAEHRQARVLADAHTQGALHSPPDTPPPGSASSAASSGTYLPSPAGPPASPQGAPQHHSSSATAMLISICRSNTGPPEPLLPQKPWPGRGQEAGALSRSRSRCQDLG